MNRNNDPWLFRHMNKFISGIFILIVLYFVFLVGGAFMMAAEIREDGLKSVVERIWEGEGEDE